MQLASGTHIPDGLLAAMTLLNEKPRHGVESRNPAPHPGIDERNSTLAIGLRASLALDAVRQSERARYYGSSMGRFLSPDWSAKVEPVPYSKIDDPQTLNLYAYVGNNPLSRTDPTGHYTAGCANGIKNCAKQIHNLNNQLQAALRSKNQDIVRAAQAYGKLGEKNGVNVTFMKVVDPKHANVLGNTGAQAGTGGITVDQATGKVQQATQVNLKAGMGGSQLQETAVHEGVHVEDRANFINTIQMTPYAFDRNLNISGRQSEINAYGVENEWRQLNGLPPIDINDVLSHPPYSDNPNINQPILPDFPGPQ